MPPIRRQLATVEERRKAASRLIQEYSDTPIDDAPPLSDKYKAHRERVWRLWISFASDILVLLDLDKPWIGLCNHSREAQQVFQAFIEDFVDGSKAVRPALGPQQWVEVQTITSVNTVLDFWKALLQEGNDRVLKEQRAKDREHVDKWTLRWEKGLVKGRARGAVYEICRWISGPLAEKYGLTREQTFEKVEATPEDVRILLNTLWTRPADINCAPNDRLSFHAIVILAGIGFRPGVVVKIPYKQVKLAIVRDPQHLDRRTLAASITLRQNKQRTGKVYQRQDHILSFNVALLPCQTLCLVSLVVIKALFDNAFEDFDMSDNGEPLSFDTILQQPNMEGSDYVELKWKHSMMEKELFSLTYNRFWELWNLVLMVAGMRDAIRPYSLRVGAGGRYHSLLSSAVGNYVLSHTGDVFQKSYQPRLVRDDLVTVAFGLPGGQNADLFAMLGRSTLQRDERAPLYPTLEDIQEFEQHEGVQTLRQELATERENERNATKMNRLNAQLQTLLKQLSKLRVQERRAAYFDAVDNRRIQGLSTVDMVEPSANPIKSKHLASSAAAACIGQFLCDEKLGTRQRPQTLARLLLPYLSGQFANVEATMASLIPQDVSKEAVEPTMVTLIPQDVSKDTAEGKGNCRCLLCDIAFSRRSNLSRHHKNKHLEVAFKRPFPCPQCVKEGSRHMISDAQGWSNHVELVHGKQYAPYIMESNAKLVAPRPPKAPACCLLCPSSGHPYTGVPGQAFSRHINNSHLFNKPFPCPKCAQQGLEYVIFDKPGWLQHTSIVHGCDGQTGHLINMATGTKRKRLESKTLGPWKKVKGEESTR
ncbi:hypothetical protein BR93DRAFT_392943 [Coniochaeta sp. PMI_546]|nr:hypothetical protein BR93DRAFT_392943 [Coniochaeta sp. PMI_546]